MHLVHIKEQVPDDFWMESVGVRHQHWGTNKRRWMVAREYLPQASGQKAWIIWVRKAWKQGISLIDLSQSKTDFR